MKKTATTLILARQAATLHVEEFLAADDHEPYLRLKAAAPEILKGDAAADCAATPWKTSNPAAPTWLATAWVPPITYTINDTAASTTVIPHAEAVVLGTISGTTTACVVTYAITTNPAQYAAAMTVATTAVTGVQTLTITTTDRTLITTALLPPVSVTLTPWYNGAPVTGTSPLGWPAETFTMAFVDPCESPDTLVAPANKTADYYIGTGGQVVWTFDAWTMTKTGNDTTACPFTYSITNGGNGFVFGACPFSATNRTITCTSASSALANMSTVMTITAKSPTDVAYTCTDCDTVATFTPTFKLDTAGCTPPTSLKPAADLTTIVVTDGNTETISVPVIPTTDIVANPASASCTVTAYCMELSTTPSVPAKTAAQITAFNAAVNLPTLPAGGTDIVVTNTNAALNGQSFVVDVWPIAPITGACMKIAGYNSKQTITFDNGCEKPLTLVRPTIAAADTLSPDYKLGEAAATMTFAPFTATWPSGVTPPTCAWTYEVSNTALDAASAITYTATSPATSTDAGKVVLNTSTASLVNATPYTIKVIAKTPGGLTVTSTTNELPLLATIVDNPACNPPKTITLPTTQIADQTYQVGQAAGALNLIFDEWPYITDPIGQTCPMTYALTVPPAITGSVVKTAADRKFTVAAMPGSAGTYQLTATAISPNGTAIPNLTYTINLTIKSMCDPPKTVNAPVLQYNGDLESRLDDTTYNFAYNGWTTASPTECQSKFRYTTSIPTELAGIVTIDTVNRHVTVKSADGTKAGVYYISVTALTESGSAFSPASTITWKLTLIEAFYDAQSDRADKILQHIYVAPTVIRVARNAVNLRPSSISSITDFTGITADQGITSRGRIDQGKRGFDTGRRGVDTGRRGVDTGRRGVDSRRVDTGRRGIDGRIDTGRRGIDGRIDTGRRGIDGRIDTGRRGIDGRIDTGRRGIDGRIDSGRSRIDQPDVRDRTKGRFSDGITAGQDSFDSRPDFNRRDEPSRVDRFGDPFADAKIKEERKITQDQVGADSFDFALDNLSGIYGDLNL